MPLYQILHSASVIGSVRFDEFCDQGFLDFGVLQVDGGSGFIELARRQILEKNRLSYE